ncbi:cyclin-D3-1-like [Chenopodium quinoa]|uniref:cyclin-D3-1-like n=1 Tax=Chenopodium quinoa TaxID=63459 RepID=UPI000B77DA52|nr:cyclin-D3-1-like [Chenopodium quinoa]
MTTLETEQEQQQTLSKNNNLLFLDCLYCEEKCWGNDDDDDDDEEFDDHDDNREIGLAISSPLHDSSSSSSSSLVWCEDDEEQLNALFSKEGNTLLNEGDLGVNKLLLEARREALEWMIKVNYHHNFSAITLVLGVNYFDKFMLSFGYQKEMPWMTHLAAVACLSLASKMEEIYVPLLLDFQVEHEQIFEAKVVQRMELLVLSTLDWKMNAVTPLSYFGHLIRKLNLKSHLHWNILTRCENLIVSAILDPRFTCYVPSVLAAASMVQTLKEIGLWSILENQYDIMGTLKLDKVKVKECYNFIQELSSKANKQNQNNLSAKRSPSNNVCDVICNDSSSNKDSPTISLMQPSEPKKCRTMGPLCFG